MACFLFVLLLVAAPRLGVTTVLLLFAITVLATVGLDLLFGYIRHRTFFFPISAIITGLILTLTIDTSAAWFEIFVIAASAMAIKNFLRFGAKHIFNPAAIGLSVGYFVFGLYPSWWAPSPYDPGQWTVANVLVLGAVLLAAYASAYRQRRWRQIGVYLLAYIVLSPFINPFSSVEAAINTIISPGTLFYALVMLPEPVASPADKNRQMMFGGFVAAAQVALVFVTLNFNTPFIFDASLIALLLGNLVFFKYR